MKILIATPMFGGMCHAGYTISLLNLIKSAEHLTDIKFETLFALNESLIPKTRSLLTHSFLNSDATHLLFIDSDISFNADEIIKMCKTEHDFVCGIYPKKIFNWEAIASAAKHNMHPQQISAAGLEYLFIPTKDGATSKDGLIEIERAGTGMMLLSRRVFEVLKDEVPTFKLESALTNVSANNEEIREYFASKIDPDSKIFLHEDFNFCKMWRDKGEKIYAAPFVQLKHIGQFTFG